MFNECKALNETDAGMELEKDILQLRQLCKSKLEEARREAQRAVLMKNDGAVTALATMGLQLQSQLAAADRALESMCGDMMTLQAQSANQLQAKLDQLRREEQQDQFLLSERQSDLDRLDRRLRKLNEELELGHTSDATGFIIQPPANSPRTANNKSVTRLTELQTVSEDCARCKKEIQICQERQDIRQHRIETCVNRLGVTAGVIGIFSEC